jgi:hypothetical protein
MGLRVCTGILPPFRMEGFIDKENYHLVLEE